MGCKSSNIKEEKKIQIFFINLYRDKPLNYSISDYELNYSFINKNSQNNFKKLEKKQKVRLNFINEVNRSIYTFDDKERDEIKTRKMKFFIIVYTIIVKKYIEENMNMQTEYKEHEDTCWLDIEQTLFNLANVIINRQFSSAELTVSMFYYTSQLLFYLTSLTKDFDNYINLEKYLHKLKLNLEAITSPEEKLIFKNSLIEVIGEMFAKTRITVLSKETHNFIISFIFSTIMENKDFIIQNNENVKHIFINKAYHSDNKSDLLSEDMVISNLLNNKSFQIIQENIESFYQYVSKFTTDVSGGKKMWKEVEEYLVDILGDMNQCSQILEITIIYIFNKNRGKVLNPARKSSEKIILSSIFEFLCDKLNSLEQIDIPIKDLNSNRNVEDNVVSSHFSPSLSKQKTVLQKNLNLFYDIMCNHYETILTDQILNERYMLYFARIFIEDTLNETVSGVHESDEHFLCRLHEILSQTSDPYKLIICLLSNISKFFYSQTASNMIQAYNIPEQNLIFLNKIYTKLIIFLNKFSHFHSKEKGTLDRDEFFNIINNFSTNFKNLRPNYVMFFIKFFIFVEYHFKLELEFLHRKKLYINIFEMFYEIIVNFHVYDNYQQNVDEFLKLLELLVIVMKTYSKFNLEDGYLIYKIISMVCKKIMIPSSNYFLGGGGGGLGVREDTLNCSSTAARQFLNKTQVILTYGLVNIVMYLITGFFQLYQANNAIPKINNEILSEIQDDENEIKDILDHLFKNIDILNLSTTLSDYHKLIHTSASNEFEAEFKNPEISQKFLEIIICKFFSTSSAINVHIEHEMSNRNLNTFVKEFNNEMTFRDFSKVDRKETDKLSEHNFSVISYRDIDAMNDINIVITEEKNSEIFRDTLMGQRGEAEATNSRREIGNYISGVGVGQYKIYPSEMDGFLTNNPINNIKI